MLTFRAGVEGRQLPPAREGHLRPRHGPTVGVELAKKNTLALGARHSFLVTLDHGYYPIDVLNTLKMVPEVCLVFCATANPTDMLQAETE